MAGEAEGFGAGALVAVGAGGGSSVSTDRVGEGKGGFLEFEFAFALSLALRFTPPISSGLALGSGEAEVFVLSGRLVVPPAGIPASDAPVGGFSGSTGLLLGSAVSEPGVVAFVGCEFRVKA